MQRIHKLLDIDLHLFDGAAGGAAGSAGAEGAQQATESNLPKAETHHKRGGSRRAEKGEYDNVVFGKQGDAPAADEGNTPPAAGEGKGEGSANQTKSIEERRKAFEEMIDGEYKDVYAEKFQKAFDRRFKDVKGMETSLTAQKPIIDMMMQRYNIADGDVAKLQSAIEQDHRYWEAEAEQAGMSTEQYAAIKKLERENQQFRLMAQREQGQRQAAQQWMQWERDAAVLQQTYENFDLRAESQNPHFMKLLGQHWPMKDAYEMVHRDEIAAAKEKKAAEAAEARIKASLQNNASRPIENGTSSQSAAIVKSDVNSLSRKDRAEVVRRARRGEKIAF